MDILIDKNYKQYIKPSRYAGFPYYWHREDNKYIYGTTSWLRDDTPHSVHIVKRGDTLDRLALNYYGSPAKYWVIADFNRITDPFKDLVIGTRLKIPTYSAIEFKNI